ncbi:MAG: biotin--[acetyl-CoA-carboxylase] ligase [Candidatus Methanomethylicaceae archaeon]
MSQSIDELLITSSFISGQKFAKSAGITRTAIFKRIQQLKRQGYNIESVRGKGYRLIPRFDGLLPLEVKAKLKTRVFGRTLITLDSVDSTQVFMRRLAEKGAPEGTVVVALEQRSGRGRMNRAWSSPKGGLWFSLLLRPSIPPIDLHKLTLLIGVAVAKSLEQYGIKASLKWPNDVLIDQRKVCGILLESSTETDRVEYVIAGIGLNANITLRDLPDAIRCSAISLYDILGTKVDRAELLSKILKNSEDLYISASEKGFSEIISLWRSLSSTIGRKVQVDLLDKTLTGYAVDIDEGGSLILETSDGLRKIYSGDVIFL